MQNIRPSRNCPQPSGGGSRRRPGRVGGVILALALGGATALLAVGASVPASAAAQAAPAAVGPHVATHAVSAAEIHATLKYWTRKRLQSARPPVIGVQGKLTKAHIGPKGTPHLVKPGRPVVGIPGPAGGVRNELAYPFPFTSSNVPTSSYGTWPYEVNGKIFFVASVLVKNSDNKTVREQEDFVCSGTSVASYHGSTLEDEVWTAGHCTSNTDLMSPGHWDVNALFIPAYNGTAVNDAPFGEYVVTRLATVNYWLNNGDFSVDEGAMEVTPSSTTGHSLGQQVGFDGFAWNEPYQENFTAFGYPAASPYTGNLMVEDQASTGTTISMSGQVGPAQIGIGNPMTGGSSGGAWNIYLPNATGGQAGPYIDGHNDYKLTSPSQPLAMYSPYQNNLTNAVRCFGVSNPPAGC